MSIGYVAGIEKARKVVKPVAKTEVKVVKATKKSTKKAAKEEKFD